MVDSKMPQDSGHEAEFGSWLKTIGFDVPGERGLPERSRPARDNERDDAEPAADRTFLAPSLDDLDVYPPLSTGTPFIRAKAVAIALGALASLSLVGVIVVAAYLSGLDRHYAPRTVTIEASRSPLPPPDAPAAASASVDPPALQPQLSQDAAPAAPSPLVVKKPRRSLEQRNSASNPTALYPEIQPPESAFQQQPPGSSGGVARARVVIHVRDGDAGSDARAGDMAARLGSTVGRLETRRVAATPNGYEIRFFHAEDSVAAHALAGMLPVEGAWRVRDFSQFRPPPSGGTLEVWLP